MWPCIYWKSSICRTIEIEAYVVWYHLNFVSLSYLKMILYPMAQSSMDLKLFILLISIYILRCIVKQIMHTSTSLCLYTLFTLVGGLSPLQIEANPQVLAEMFLGWKYYNPYCLIEISCASYTLHNFLSCFVCLYCAYSYYILDFGNSPWNWMDDFRVSCSPNIQTLS